MLVATATKLSLDALEFGGPNRTRGFLNVHGGSCHIVKPIFALRNCS